MVLADRARWDERYQGALPSRPQLPERFRPFIKPGGPARALEIACGVGQASLWLARHGTHVSAFDISPVAIKTARIAAAEHEVEERCQFHVADFDKGLPQGEPVDLVLCNMFRDPRLDQELVERLAPGGMLAIAALSEVGAEPGRFRIGPGELQSAFTSLHEVASHEADGVAWLVATNG